MKTTTQSIEGVYNYSIDLTNETASQEFAKKVALAVKPPLILAFIGDLGAGKTTIIRAMLRHLGIQSAIKSPTFSLVESYTSGDLQIHHFDLYRIGHEEELEYLGFRDYFTLNSICCIEWAERAGKALPKVDVSFHISVKGTGRVIQARAETEVGKTLLTCLAGSI